MSRPDFLKAAEWADHAERYESFAGAYLDAGQLDDAHDAALIADGFRYFERHALRGDA